MDFSSSSLGRAAGHGERTPKCDDHSDEPTPSPEVKVEAADKVAPTSVPLAAMPAGWFNQDADLYDDLPATAAPMALPNSTARGFYNDNRSNNSNGFSPSPRLPSPVVDYGAPMPLYTGVRYNLPGQEYGATMAPCQMLHQYQVCPDASTMPISPHQLHLPHMAGAVGLGAMPAYNEYGCPDYGYSPPSSSFGSVPPLDPSSDDRDVVGVAKRGSPDSFLGYPHAGDVEDGGVLGYRNFLSNAINHDQAEVGGAGRSVAIMSDSRRNANGHKGEEPYAQLICRALLSVESRAMTLQEIYTWFKNNTDKDRGDGSRGWQNSVRHNLSMNAAFTKRERKLPMPSPADDDGSSPDLNGYGNALAAATYSSNNKSEWFLEDWAYEHGVQSTTRYRKHHAGGRRARGVATGRIRRRSRATSPNLAALQHGLQQYVFPRACGGRDGGVFQPPRFDEPVMPPGGNHVGLGALDQTPLPFDGGGHGHHDAAAVAVAGADGLDNGFGGVAPEFGPYSNLGDDADRFGGLWSADAIFQGPYY